MDSSTWYLFSITNLSFVFFHQFGNCRALSFAKLTFSCKVFSHIRQPDLRKPLFSRQAALFLS